MAQRCHAVPICQHGTHVERTTDKNMVHSCSLNAEPAIQFVSFNSLHVI